MGGTLFYMSWGYSFFLREYSIIINEYSISLSLYSISIAGDTFFIKILHNLLIIRK